MADAVMHGIPRETRASISTPDRVETRIAWFTIVRPYGHLAPWFDRTWRPGGIVRT